MVAEDLSPDGVIDPGVATVDEIRRYLGEVPNAEPSIPQAGRDIGPRQSTLIRKLLRNRAVRRCRNLPADGQQLRGAGDREGLGVAAHWLGTSAGLIGISKVIKGC